jgi:hypothetical protein
MLVSDGRSDPNFSENAPFITEATAETYGGLLWKHRFRGGRLNAMGASVKALLSSKAVTERHERFL